MGPVDRRRKLNQNVLKMQNLPEQCRHNQGRSNAFNRAQLNYLSMKRTSLCTEYNTFRNTFFQGTVSVLQARNGQKTRRFAALGKDPLIKDRKNS